MKKLCLFFFFACSFIVLGMENERGLSGSGGGSSDLLVDTYTRDGKPSLNGRFAQNGSPIAKHPSLENLRRSREKFERKTDIKKPNQDAIKKAEMRRNVEGVSKKK